MLLHRYMICALFLLCTVILQAQDSLPTAQWSFEVEAGHGLSLNPSYYSKEIAPLQAKLYQYSSGAYWALRGAHTWQHTHRLSFGAEVIHHHYHFHYERTNPQAIATTVNRDLYYGAVLVYSHNVLKHPRWWWGPIAQLGIAGLAKNELLGDSLWAASKGQMPALPRDILGMYGFGMDGGYALIRNKLWLELSARFWHAFDPRATTQYLYYTNEQGDKDQVMVYTGLFNVNLGARLRYSF